MNDLISRQAAIDALDVLCQEHRYKIPGKRETYSQYNEAWQDALGMAEGAIFNLPSAQSERKRGKWRLNKEGNWACPFCEFDPYHDNMKGMNYCPNCGAELRGEDDGHD